MKPQRLPAAAVATLAAALDGHHAQKTLEDRKYGYFWIFTHHGCENIQKYFEFLDTFGYSPIISEQLSDVLGGQSPP